MKITPLIMLLAVLVSACSVTRHIPYDQVKARTFSLNMAAQLEPVHVRTSTNPLMTEVSYFSIVADSALWIVEETQKPVSIPLPQLQSFTVVDRAKGMSDGAMIGTGIGLALGVALYAADTDIRLDQALLGSTLIGFDLGALTGMVLGANVTFAFDAPPGR